MAKKIYQLTVFGRGAEITIGSVDRKIYDYFKVNNVDINEFAEDYDDNLEIPEELRPFEAGCAYDCDNLAHENGCFMDADSEIKITDVKGQVIFQSTLEVDVLKKKSVHVSPSGTFDSSHIEKGTAVISCFSLAKGVFWKGSFETKGDFDIQKLEITFETIDKLKLLGFIMYDGEDVENGDFSTTGKGDELEFFLAGGSESVAEKTLAPTFYPVDADYTHYFMFPAFKPVHLGSYSCRWGDVHSSNNGWLYWNGKDFIEQIGKKPYVKTKQVSEWRGFNWDTRDINNRPKQI